jgi:probable rRNA maturation factor
MPVSVSVEGPSSARTKALRKTVETWNNAMLKALRIEHCELSVVLTDDATIHTLNRDYRKMDKPTDVLAFAMREGPLTGFSPDLLGDVVISLETAERQAAEVKRSLEEEVAMLSAHGLLHLLGFDHRDRQEERRMTARTDMLRAVCAKASARSSKLLQSHGGSRTSGQKRSKKA